MSGHTPWKDIKHKKNASAVEVVVYSMTGNRLPDGLRKQVEQAVENLVKQHDDVAINVVGE